MKKLIFLIFLSFFLISNLLAEEKKGAKAIFHSGEGPVIYTKPQPAQEKVQQNKKPEVETYMGITYWIDLVKSTGERSRVTTDRNFRSGERIKLNLQTNKDGYLHVINIGTTGTSRILFPHKTDMDNFVKAGKPVGIPLDAFMRFDETPGEETILVMLSPKKMTEFSPSSVKLKDVEEKELTALVRQKGAKDLIIETDAVSKSPAQYAVVPVSELDEGKFITLQIKLKHTK